MSYLSNSPESMLGSLAKMPFVSHNKVAQIYHPKTPFVNGHVYYQKLEEGFYVMHTDFEYKANMLFNLLYDKKIPTDYYFLSYNYSENDYLQTGTLINNIKFSSRSWTLFKPGVNEIACYFKGTIERNVTLYFSEDWLNKNLKIDRQFVGSSFASFFESKEKYIYWPDISKLNDIEMANFVKIFKERDENGIIDILRMKIRALEMISVFINKYEEEHIGSLYVEIPNKDRIRLLKVEKFLCENLYGGFEGIEAIAEKFKVSPTKLKMDFKIYYGKTIYRYFQERQMVLAKGLLNTQDVRVKEVANKLGYENQGKFSNAYKKQFGVLPSDELQNN
ncbi:AraC-type DNA-binding protein [Spirosomataceae bacterium TFI 002]|nr:AraC-type DNA-binding protein [Spirosomataceae bacterium TFI 002]